MNHEISKSQWDHLASEGFLRLPRAFFGALNELQFAVSQIQTAYPYGFADPNYYTGTKPTALTAETARPDGRILIPYIGFLDTRILKPLANDYLLELVERIVGRDFYLSNTWYQSVPPKTKRLSYHKDPRGSITLTILLDDIRNGMGSTCLVPGTHINTPPAAYCMKDIHAKHPKEVDMIGDAGDAVLFSTETWHARSKNESEFTTRRLFYNFYSRSSRHTTAWNGIVPTDRIDAARAVLPAKCHYMFEIDAERTTRLSCVSGSKLRQWAFAKSSSTDLARDAVYAAFAYGRTHDNHIYQGMLEPFTTRLISARRYNATEYFLYLQIIPVLKNLYVFARKKIQSWTSPRSSPTAQLRSH